MRKIRIIPSLLVSVMIIVLVTATIIEKFFGTTFVMQYVYDSWWFTALWILIAICLVISIVKMRHHIRLAPCAIHIAILVILFGALLTKLTSQHGKMYLCEGKIVSVFTENYTKKELNMPFTLCLHDFSIHYYPGTYAPMDFVSKLLVLDDDKTKMSSLSMNKMLRYKGYRFYQSGYDIHGNVTLSVAHDPYGITVTYIGYALLLISLIAFFFDKKTRFHATIKGFLAVLLLFASTKTISADEKRFPQTLPTNVAEKFGELYVQYNDRICPLQTMARDFTIKLYGKPSYKGYSAEQVLVGWLFYTSEWCSQPMIRVKNAELRAALGVEGRYASYNDFIDEHNQYKLKDVIKTIRLGGLVPSQRAYQETDEKFNLATMLCSGKMMHIYPQKNENGAVVWYAQSDSLPDNISNDERLFVRKSQSYLAELAAEGKYDELCLTIDKIKLYQKKNADNNAPPTLVMNAERVYNSMIDLNMSLATTCLTLGILLFAYCIITISARKEQNKTVMLLAKVVASVMIVYLTIMIVLRWIIGGYIPLSNGFETMQFMAWSMLLLALLLYKRTKMSLPSGIMIGGMAMMVSMMSDANPHVTRLVPMLNSPLLTIHVAVLMLAYSLLAFIMLNGVAGLTLLCRKRYDYAERLRTISVILLYPAVFCLTIGIMVGAVWANVSWGTYWNWDPKETWALSTLLFYSLALHDDAMPVFRQPIFFHLFAVTAFLLVLFTYFGVNYLLGGLHSYA